MASSSSSSSSPSTPSDKLLELLNQALGSIRRNNIITAHHVLNDSRRHHQDSAIFHRFWGPVFYFYSTDKNPNVDQSRVEPAVTSAKRATQLSPNNLDFSLGYVKLLIAVRGLEELQEAVEECERALAIANPIGFSLAPIQETTDMHGISRCKGELQFLLNVFKDPLVPPLVKKQVVISPYMFKIRSHLQSFRTLDEWKDFFRIDVNEFKETLSHIEILREALEFAERNCSWMFWSCPLCRPEPHFANPESLMEHVFDEHLENPPEELEPKEADHDLVDKLIKGSWDPIYVQPPTKNDDDDHQERPVSDDPVRKTLLNRIKFYIWKLAKDNCLSMRNLDRVVTVATREVLPALGVGATDDQSTNCIRFLDSKKLQEQIVFLERLMEASKLGPSEDTLLDTAESNIDIPQSTVLAAFLDDNWLRIDLNMDIIPWSTDAESRRLPDVDSVIFWLYDFPHPVSWYQAWCKAKRARKLQAKGILERLVELYEDLSMRYSDQNELLAYLGSLQDLEEFSKSESRDYVDYILSDFLREVQVFGPSRASDSGDIIDAKFQEIDSSIKDKLGVVDVGIMKILTAIRRLVLNLGCISWFDYFPAIAPLIQTYIPRASMCKLEELAKGDPEAARAQTLEELLLTSKRLRDDEIRKAKRNRKKSKKLSVDRNTR